MTGEEFVRLYEKFSDGSSSSGEVEDLLGAAVRDPEHLRTFWGERELERLLGQVLRPEAAPSSFARSILRAGRDEGVSAAEFARQVLATAGVARKDDASPSPSGFRSRLIPLAAAALFLGFILFYISTGPPSEPAAVVLQVSGQAVLVGKDGTRALRTGDPIPAGSTVRTGAGGSVRLRTRGGIPLDLGSGSELTVPSGAAPMSLERGRVGAAVRRALVVRTPHAEVRTETAEFTLIVIPGSTRLEVNTGTAGLTRLADGRGIDAVGGYSIAASAGVPLVRESLDLLTDPGFENEGEGWEGIREEVSIVTAPVRSGVRALQAKLPEDGEPLVIETEAPVTGGATYTASGWIRTRGIVTQPAEPSHIVLVWEDPTGRELRRDYVGLVRGNRDWTLFSGEYTAPGEAGRVRFSLIAESAPDGGTVWFDDLHFAGTR